MKAGTPGTTAGKSARTPGPAQETGEISASLDALLCFDVYTTSRALTRAYRPLLEPLGLTYPQYLVMMALWDLTQETVESDAPPPATVGTLGVRLDLDSGTLSPLLKRLEGAGLVRRERSVRDEREVAVHLTDLGRDLQVQAQQVPARIEAQVDLSARERGLLQAALRQLRTNLARD